MYVFPFVIASALCLLIASVFFVIAVKLVIKEHLVIAALCGMFAFVILALGAAMVEEGVESWRVRNLPVVKAPPLRNQRDGLPPGIDHVIPLQPSPAASAPPSWMARPNYEAPARKSVRVGPMT